MGDNAGPLLPIGVGEAALIGINPLPQPKIIKVAHDPAAGGRPEELRAARGKAALYQQPVERLEELARERMLLAATLPGGAVQRLQLSEEG